MLPIIHCWTVFRYVEKIIYCVVVKNNIKSVCVMCKKRSKQIYPDINRILLPQRNDDSLPAGCVEEGNLQTSPREACWALKEMRHVLLLLCLLEWDSQKAEQGCPETSVWQRSCWLIFYFCFGKGLLLFKFLMQLINTQPISFPLLLTDVYK